MNSHDLHMVLHALLMVSQSMSCEWQNIYSWSRHSLRRPRQKSPIPQFIWSYKGRLRRSRGLFLLFANQPRRWIERAKFRSRMPPFSCQGRVLVGSVGTASKNAAAGEGVDVVWYQGWIWWEPTGADEIQLKSVKSNEINNINKNQWQSVKPNKSNKSFRIL